MAVYYDVAGIGNAIVDMISRQEEAFLDTWDIQKDAMTLIDQERAESLGAAAGDSFETSGGSGANTVAGIASLGGKAAYMGKVADDRLGRRFQDDMVALGVHFEPGSQANGLATARSIIFVTPDSKRSMNTFLGASAAFSKTDIDEKVIADSGILYMEGYLFDRPAARDAFNHAARIAHAAGRTVSLTLSDPFCVDRHRDSFRRLIATGVDIVLANEQEILSLYQTTDFDSAIASLRRETSLAAITRGALGSVIIGNGVTDGDRLTVPAEPVNAVIDTTGAGDQYAAGFLFGLARGAPLALCARLGHIAAAEVIAHYGPRPEVSLKALYAKAGIVI